MNNGGGDDDDDDDDDDDLWCVASIVYNSMSCNEKRGTFGTLKLIENHEVDAVFGGICSTGALAARTQLNPFSLSVHKIATLIQGFDTRLTDIFFSF